MAYGCGCGKNSTVVGCGMVTAKLRLTKRAATQVIICSRNRWARALDSTTTVGYGGGSKRCGNAEVHRSAAVQASAVRAVQPTSRYVGLGVDYGPLSTVKSQKQKGTRGGGVSRLVSRCSTFWPHPGVEGGIVVPMATATPPCRASERTNVLAGRASFRLPHVVR